MGWTGWGPQSGYGESRMDKEITLGSLFDGAGGFPYAGKLAGITPRWASEIEPLPIRVTTKRLPEVKHLGNITEIDGRDIEPVDIITFGSPCQDLSVAGNRKGLAGERSGLFLEAIRLIREMREKTDGRKPEFIVWENVPGAFTSNRGEDFRTVLEEIAKVKDGGGGQYLDLRTANGNTPGRFWETATASHGEPTTRNTGESPSEERESTLSQILEETAPEKYNLSPTACAGILKRAEKAGKQLPKLLEETLKHQAGQSA